METPPDSSGNKSPKKDNGEYVQVQGRSEGGGG